MTPSRTKVSAVLRSSARKKSKNTGPWSSPGRSDERLRRPAGQPSPRGAASPWVPPARPAPLPQLQLPSSLSLLPSPFPPSAQENPGSTALPGRGRSLGAPRPPPAPRPPRTRPRRVGGAAVQPRPPRQNKGMWGGGEKEERRPPSSPGPSAAQGRSLPLTEVRARHPTSPPSPDPQGPQLGGARWEEGSTPKVAIGRWRYAAPANPGLPTRAPE